MIYKDKLKILEEKRNVADAATIIYELCSKADREAFKLLQRIHNKLVKRVLELKCPL